MLKLSSSRGIRIEVPVLCVSWSVENHSVIIQALKKGLIEHEASDTGGVPRWKSSCPDRLAEATVHKREIDVPGTKTQQHEPKNGKNYLIKNKYNKKNNSELKVVGSPIIVMAVVRD